jgi:hypothetical protein
MTRGCYNLINGDGTYSIQVQNGEHVRPAVHIKIGGTYLIDPPNPQKLKHRGRTCTILEFIYDEKLGDFIGPRAARVRFLDNNRQGVVNDMADFIAAPGQA